MEQEFNVIVSHQGRDYSFSFLLHLAEEVQELYMSIYPKKEELEFPHFEIEVIEKPRVTLLHKHLIKKKTFVCWTGHLPTEEIAKKLAQWWACGEVYRHITGIDYSSIISEDRPVLDLSFFKEADISAVIEEGKGFLKTGCNFYNRFFLIKKVYSYLLIFFLSI